MDVFKFAPPPHRPAQVASEHDYEWEALKIINKCVLNRKRPSILTLSKAIERELRKAHSRGLKAGRAMGAVRVLPLAKAGGA